ncbi:hypothetical protein [Methanobrevibacter sp.]|uniref:hypothetical protein n=1 Tax=Methanobrevibacter sp. TaxID=66852 RepID=UPI00388EE6B6
MKVVKIKDNYYGVIEDNDDLDAISNYSMEVYAIDDTQYTTPISVIINYIDDVNRIVGNDGTVLLPEIDEFAIPFTICPTIISEARFRFLCGTNNINYKLLPGLTMDIHRVKDYNEFDKIQKEVDEFLDNEVMTYGK